MLENRLYYLYAISGGRGATAEVNCISESVLDLDFCSLSQNCYKKKDKITTCLENCAVRQTEL